MQNFKYKGTPEQMAKVVEWLLSRGYKWWSKFNLGGPFLKCTLENGDFFYASVGEVYKDCSLKPLPAELELEIFGKMEQSLITENSWKENTGVAPNVPADTLLDVVLKSESVDSFETWPKPCSYWDWSLEGIKEDITHWRFHKPEDAQYYQQPKTEPKLPMTFGEVINTPENMNELQLTNHYMKHKKEIFLEDAYTQNPYVEDFDEEIPQGRVIDITEAIQIAKDAGWTSVGSAPEGWTETPLVKRNKYMREVKPGVWCDVYDILRAWNVTDQAHAHALKKMLCPGTRGHKDTLEDYKDIVASCNRALELHKEWHE